MKDGEKVPEFDPKGAWHRARCPMRSDGDVCFGWPSGTWEGACSYYDYGHNREFVGRTCSEVWAEEEAAFAAWHAKYHADGNVVDTFPPDWAMRPVTVTECDKHERPWFHGPSSSWTRQTSRTCRAVYDEQRAQPAPVPAKSFGLPEGDWNVYHGDALVAKVRESEWVRVTEGLTREGDRCTTHPGNPIAAGCDVTSYAPIGCVIERRVEQPEARTVGVDLARDDAADATSYSISNVKPWDVTWMSSDEFAQRDEDAALGRLVRTVRERWGVFFISEQDVMICTPTMDFMENLADHNGSLRVALAVADARALGLGK